MSEQRTSREILESYGIRTLAPDDPIYTSGPLIAFGQPAAQPQRNGQQQSRPSGEQAEPPSTRSLDDMVRGTAPPDDPAYQYPVVVAVSAPQLQPNQEPPPEPPSIAPREKRRKLVPRWPHPGPAPDPHNPDWADWNHRYAEWYLDLMDGYSNREMVWVDEDDGGDQPGCE